MKNFGNKRGFSFLEVIVMLSIVGIAGSVSMVIIKEIKYKSLQVEAKQKLRFAHNLISSWQAENKNSHFTKELCEKNGKANGLEYCQLSGRQNVDCEYSNPFGYKDGNCLNSHYSLTFLIEGNDALQPLNWRVNAVLKENAISDNDEGADSWSINACEKICQFKKILSFVPFKFGSFDCDKGGGNELFFFCRDRSEN